MLNADQPFAQGGRLGHKVQIMNSKLNTPTAPAKRCFEDIRGRRAAISHVGGQRDWDNPEQSAAGGLAGSAIHSRCANQSNCADCNDADSSDSRDSAGYTAHRPPQPVYIRPQ